MGLKRNLTSEEIVDQVLFSQDILLLKDCPWIIQGQSLVATKSLTMLFLWEWGAVFKLRQYNKGDKDFKRQGRI